MYKRYYKPLSAFLALLLVICLIPLTSFAKAEDGGFIETGPAEELHATPQELPALRDAFSKHYIAQDGSSYAMIFPEQVHYFSGNTWKEIDNTLALDADLQKYVSANPQFPVSFAQSTSNGELVTISDGEHTLSWSIAFSGSSGGLEVMSLGGGETVSASQAAILDVASLREIGKAVSAIKYSAVFDDAVDLEYFIYHGKIKENVILNSLGGFSSYTLTVNTGDLTAVKEADGSVSFVDASGEAVFKLGVPWMQDAEYDTSADIAVTVTQIGSTAKITYTPDHAWLAEADRAYPVLIDPSFTTRQYTSNIEDTYVYEGDSASAARASETTLKVGEIDGKKYYAYIKIKNIPELLTGGQTAVTKATFSFCADITTSCSFNVYKPLGSWDPETITYSTRPVADTLSKITSTATYTMNVGGASCGVDITGFARNNWSSWNGVIVELEPSDSLSSVSLISSESTRTGLRPFMQIWYYYYSAEFIEEGAIYSFQNAASNMYLTVAEDSNGANAYQSTLNNGAIGENQAFRVNISTSGSLAFRAICSSDGSGRSLKFDYFDTVDDTLGYVPQNLYLYNNTANSKNSAWLLVDVDDDIDGGDDTLFMIVSKADPNLVLTANGTAVGSASGSDITSAGNVYVAPYTGDASQHWRVITGGCVQDVACTNIKTINGTTETYYRNAGTYQLSCPAVTFGETVTWTSTNQNVVSVDENGVCIIKEPGHATIAAHALDSEYVFDIYVRLRDGVYTFTNSTTGKRLSYGTEAAINGDSILTVVDVVSGASVSRADMFKIEYIANGRYRISSMLNSQLYLTPQLCWVEASREYIYTLTDALNAPSFGYIIECLETGGYYINQPGTGYLLHDQSLEDNGYPLVFLQDTELDDQNIDLRLWTLDQVYVPGSGITVRNPHSTVTVGGKYAFDAVAYTSVTDWSNNGEIVWSVTNGSGSASIDPSTGVLTGISAGIVTVKASYVVDGAVKFFEEFDVNVITLQSATYFIRNEEYRLYLDAEYIHDSYVPDIVWDLYSTQDTALRWKFVHVYDDYYYIINVKSGFYLTVLENMAAGRAVVLESSPANNERSVWKLTELASGSYKIQPVCCLDTDLALYTRNHDLMLYHFDESSDECVFKLEGLELQAVNYVNSSFTNDSPTDCLDKAYEFINYVYTKYFNVSITVDGTPIYDTISGINDCASTGACSNSNGCGASCSQHHKNLSRISDAIYNSPRKNGYLYVLWTNQQDFCSEVSGQHKVIDTLGVCIGYRPVIHIMQLYDVSYYYTDNEYIANVKLASAVYSLAHELAHSFGLGEMYNEANHDVLGDTCCLLEKFDPDTAYDFYLDVLNGDAEAFCPSCRELLGEKLATLVIDGNT